MDTHLIVICRKDKVNKQNEAPLAIKISQNYKSKKVSLGIKVNIDYWDFEGNRLKDETPNKEHIQFLIDSTFQELNRKILNYRIQNKEFTIDDLLGVSGKKQKVVTIEKYFMQLIAQQKEIGKLSTASKYHFCLSSLSKFQSMNISFSDIDFQFLKDYEIYLRKKGLANNSIATKFSCFKAAYNKALEDNIFACEDSPFKKFKVGRLWTQTRKRAIHKEDIHNLKEFDLSTLAKYPTPYLEFARDIFLFSYYTAGINFKDIATLRYCDFDNGRIYYSRHKTQKNINTMLLPDALAILNKYSKEGAGVEDYIFPILDRNIHITEQQQADRIQKVLKQVNRRLKIISKALDLKINLTTYVARHTFATVLKRSGVDIGIISESLGHSDLKTTQIYLDSFENSQMDAAMQNLL